MFVKKLIKNHIGILTINREDALNAMNPNILIELDLAVKECIKNKDVGIVIITGSGDKAFIAGADIKEFTGLDKKASIQF